ncbi:recombinase family protein [Aneurinibacillus tyrosinisolvens]|uniref:recombinase family protein n=1 Tax=Aneurinibacillus tyrosinisolvens TaxID=1443435 RepID=UPI00063F10C8|nr:recombinase family protein [Aneurinibacillus tyrosinisolvens]
MRCAIYARVSTKREEQTHSLKNQIIYANSKAKDYSFTVVETYVDNGISGGTLQNRPEVLRLLEDAKKKKFDVLIAKSVSRLSRDMVEGYQIADELERLNIRLILPEDSYDTETSSSRFMFNLKAILAEEESAKLSERIKLGLQSRAKQGAYKASLVAYGYKRNPHNQKLIKDEIYAPIVRKIFNLYLYEDWGLYRIGNYLMQENIPTPRSVSGGSNAGSRWHQSSVQLILTNAIYTGQLIQHKEETTKFHAKDKAGRKKNYKIRKAVAPNKQIIIENAHPAIITMDEHLAVLEKMKKKGRNKSNGQESLFAHIAICADCKSGMTYRKDRRKGAYVCCGYVKHTKAYCSSHIIEAENLLQAVRNDFKQLVSNNVKVEKLYEIAAKQANSQKPSYIQELKAVKGELEGLSNKFQSLLHLYTDSIVTKEQFRLENEKIQTQQERLNKRKLELESILEKEKDTEQQFRAFQKLVDRFTQLDINDEQVLRQMLQQLINKIEVHEDGSLKIYYNITRPLSAGV